MKEVDVIVAFAATLHVAVTLVELRLFPVKV